MSEKYPHYPEWMWGPIPDGYELREYGEPMQETDLVWTYNSEMGLGWQPFGRCEDVDYPYNESYRPIIKLIKGDYKS